MSRTADDSELYQLNHRELTPVKGTRIYQVSASLAELVSKGLDYSAFEGAFDIAIEPLTSISLQIKSQG